MRSAIDTCQKGTHMYPLHPVVARELAAAHIQDPRTAADFDRATRPAIASAPRTRHRTGQRPTVVGPGVPSRRRVQVCLCT
jgi:hypothetical protein